MKLPTLKQFEKKTKASLIRYVVKHLKKKTKKQLAIFAYNITKSTLPKLEPAKQKKLTKKKNKNTEKKERTAKQKRADKKNGIRLKRWMKENR